MTVSERGRGRPDQRYGDGDREVPSGLRLVSMAGTGWTCRAAPDLHTERRSGGGASYPAITVTVNVAASATFAAGECRERVGRGFGERQRHGFDDDHGQSAKSASAKTHAGNFTQGQTGATYFVAVSNAAGTHPPRPTARLR